MSKDTEHSLFPKGRRGVEMTYQLSQNIAKEYQQQYISIGVLASVYPDKTGQEIMDFIAEFEVKEERPELVIRELD